MNKYYDGAKKESVIKEVIEIKKDKFTRDDIAQAYDKLIALNFLPQV